MFSKYATLLAFAASAIAGAIEPGIYRITNVASQSTARSYKAYSPPIFVSSTKENPGLFELWDVRESEGGTYTLHNVGLNATGAAFYYYLGADVRTGYSASEFSIEPAGYSGYVIKVPNENYFWNAEPPIVPHGDIRLRPSDGNATQLWIFTRSPPDSAQK